MARTTDVTGIAHRSEVVSTRRGYTLLGLGLILPGSAQAVHGSKRVGRFALKLLIVIALLAVVALLLTLFFRNTMIGIFANGWFLKSLAIAIFALCVFWAALMVNTWWISSPQSMGTKKGAIFSVVALLLTVAMVLGTVWVGRAAWATGGALTNIFSGGGDTQQNKGRFNILLLGSDAGPDREGVRPDSITIASVSADTGRTVLFSLPRNLEWVPFPEDSPLHSLYPDGYGCESEECMLNAVYLLGIENPSLYPGVDDPGIQAMIDAVRGITGLPINYFAMIDMQGFIDLIDAMGGLTITINERVALNPADDVWLEPGVDRHLSGYETLWFARSRALASDFVRMQRQKCVMAAMLKELNPTTVATKFTQLAAASGEAVRTSVPASEVGELTDLALKARALPIISVSFVPPLIHPGDPDYAFIQATVANTIAESEALDSGTPAPESPPDQTQESAPEPADQGDETGEEDSTPSDDSTDTPAITDDLDQVCSVS